MLSNSDLVQLHVTVTSNHLLTEAWSAHSGLYAEQDGHVRVNASQHLSLQHVEILSLSALALVETVPMY